MKKSFYIYSLIAIAVVYVALSVILVVALPDQVTSRGLFWSAYVCGIAVPAIFSLFFVSLNLFKKEKGIAKIAPFSSLFTLDVLLFILGVVFCCINADTKTAQIIVFILAYAVYFLVFGFVYLGSKKITSNDAEVKEKVSYIRNLQVSIDAVALKAKTADVKKALEDLSSAVRYSDPMSSKEVKDIEDGISQKVNSLAADIETAEENSLLSAIKETKDLVELRKLKCKMNK